MRMNRLDIPLPLSFSSLLLFYYRIVDLDTSRTAWTEKKIKAAYRSQLDQSDTHIPRLSRFFSSLPLDLLLYRSPITTFVISVQYGKSQSSLGVAQ